MNKTLFEDKATIFHQMDPLFKLAWGTLMMIWILYLSDPTFQIIMFVCLIIIAWIFAKIHPFSLIKPIRVFIGLGVFMIIFQALFARGEIVIWSLGVLSATREGLIAGLTVGLRLILIVCISMILAFTTDPRKLVVSLIQYLKVPYRFAYALFATLRFIPLMHNDAIIITEAQSIRGARMNRAVTAKVKQFIMLLIPLIISGIRNASQSAIAMDSRAFGYLPVRTNLIKVQIRPSGPILFVITLILFILHLALLGQHGIRWMY